MALDTYEMRFNGIKIAFFSKKHKKSPNSATRLPTVQRLRYTTFLNTSPKLDICPFQLLLKALSLCKILLKC